MATRHHVEVTCSDELWRQFRGRCLMEGVELRVVVAQLIAAHMGVNPPTGDDAIPGQLTTDEPPASPAPRRRARKPATKGQGGAQTPRKARASTKPASSSPRRRRGAQGA